MWLAADAGAISLTLSLWLDVTNCRQLAAAEFTAAAYEHKVLQTELLQRPANKAAPTKSGYVWTHTVVTLLSQCLYAYVD